MSYLWIPLDWEKPTRNQRCLVWDLVDNRPIFAIWVDDHFEEDSRQRFERGPVPAKEWQPEPTQPWQPEPAQSSAIRN